ncbi:restriction endonuclease subunit S [Citrobacter portucalensis]|uniref:restriction endonuclease subunit S n=1 Tax=Citrobacter portucalensis TaxID=1639133 RepID=UPI00226B424F|nr:restriction endonuclease subunit S [Citrobacter portucalensis]MCX9007185.1 restriction endonuclease subunit S [Citrobacter portucalensis]
MSGGKLPEGWVKSDLDNILLSIIGGGTPSKAIPEYYQGDIPWMSVKDMNKHALTDTIDHITSDAVENSSTNVIPAGTPIIATRMSLGKIVTASFDSAINQDLKALFLSREVDRNFFIHWYRSQAQLIESLGTGTTVKGIRLEVLKALTINLPPLTEQKIIAEKLDTLLAQVDSTKTRLEQIPQILKRFRQAVLAAAVNGNLNRNAKLNTKVRTLQEVGIIIKTGPFGSALHKSDYISNGIPVINPMHINDGIISPSLSMTISDEKYAELSSWSLQDGDVIVGRRGEMGRAAVINIGQSKMLCGTGSMILRTKKNINPKYLELILRSPTSISYFNKEAVGSTMVNLNQKVINSLEVYLPNIDEQVEIIRRVEQLFAYADTIEKQVNNALTRVNNLTQSILAKAFRGELTAQWRAENPDLISGENSAAALLEKIKAERAASGGKKTSRKKS